MVPTVLSTIRLSIASPHANQSKDGVQGADNQSKRVVSRVWRWGPRKNLCCSSDIHPNPGPAKTTPMFVQAVPEYPSPAWEAASKVLKEVLVLCGLSCIGAVLPHSVIPSSICYKLNVSHHLASRLIGAPCGSCRIMLCIHVPRAAGLWILNIMQYVQVTPNLDAVCAETQIQECPQAKFPHCTHLG